MLESLCTRHNSLPACFAYHSVQCLSDEWTEISLKFCQKMPVYFVNAVVHGCPQSTDPDEADVVNYVTVIPHPCTHTQSLQVLP